MESYLCLSMQESGLILGKRPPKKTGSSNGFSLLKSYQKAAKKRKHKNTFKHKWHEIYEENQPHSNSYFITFNMDPSHDDYPLPSEEKEFFNQLLTKTIKQGPNLKKGYFVYEYSKNGKFHIHGLVYPFADDGKTIPVTMKRYYDSWSDWTIKSQSKHYAINYKRIKDKKHMQDVVNYLRKDAHNKERCYIYIADPKKITPVIDPHPYVVPHQCPKRELIKELQFHMKYHKKMFI